MTEPLRWLQRVAGVIACMLAPATMSDFVGDSPAIRAALELAQKAAVSDSKVVILGESGTGKGVVARRIHEQGRRRQKAFLDVHCGAVAHELLESELFGHERGAFTGAVIEKPGLFELADGGTLFLDEFAEMSPEMQSKLLKVLDHGELRRVGGVRTITVDVRVIVATNRDVDELVRTGRLREDLLHRVDVIRITMPPLRERPEDIPRFVMHFLALQKRRGLSEGLLLMPGNNLGYFGPEEGLLRSQDPAHADHFGGCQAGRFVMGIESDGAVKGCPSLQTASYVGGNVLERHYAAAH